MHNTLGTSGKTEISASCPFSNRVVRANRMGLRERELPSLARLTKHRRSTNYARPLSMRANAERPSEVGSLPLWAYRIDKSAVYIRLIVANQAGAPSSWYLV